VADAKKKRDPHTLKEAGIARYAYLTEPDEYEGKKQYKIDVIYPEVTPYVKKLIAAIDKRAEAELAKAKSGAKTKAAAKKCKMCEDMPYAEVEDDDGNKTGEMRFRFKMNYQYKNKSGKVVTLKPALFNAKGEKIEGDIRIGSGSLVKVAFNFYPFTTPKVGSGVSLRMNAVQVIKLVEWGGGTAEEFGFGEEEAEDAFTGTGTTGAAAREDDGFPEDDLEDEAGEEEEEEGTTGEEDLEDDF
jgi:hypothetical protein